MVPLAAGGSNCLHTALHCAPFAVPSPRCSLPCLNARLPTRSSCICAWCGRTSARARLSATCANCRDADPGGGRRRRSAYPRGGGEEGGAPVRGRSRASGRVARPAWLPALQLQLPRPPRVLRIPVVLPSTAPRSPPALAPARRRCQLCQLWPSVRPIHSLLTVVRVACLLPSCMHVPRAPRHLGPPSSWAVASRACTSYKSSFMIMAMDVPRCPWPGCRLCCMSRNRWRCAGHIQMYGATCMQHGTIGSGTWQVKASLSRASTGARVSQAL